MPMNVWANPDPGMSMIGELNEVAMAFDSIVLPVPGAPMNSSPRSGLPPARLNSSPDCHREMTRVTSSLGSAWPRTSVSRTPQSASPGSNAFICMIPMIARGPKRIRALNRKNSGKRTSSGRICGSRSRNSFPRSGSVPNSVVSWPAIRSTTHAITSRPSNVSRNQVRWRNLVRQYQVRRRATTSASSSSCGAP
jgi:hypothetical protein